MFRTYSQDILDLFQSAIKGNRKAFKTLMEEKKRPELAAFSNAVKGDESAEMWLKARVSEDWWLMCKALNYDQNALSQLQENDDKFYVSFVLACHNRIEGKYWLKKENLERFFPICEALAETVNVRIARETFWYDAFR